MARKRFRQVIEGWVEEQLAHEENPVTDAEIIQGLWESGLILNPAGHAKDGYVAEITSIKTEILPMNPFHGVEEQRS